MLKIINTETETSPNVFGETLRDAFFEESTSYVHFTLRPGFSDLSKDTQSGKKILAILGLIIDVPVEIIDDDVYWKNMNSNNSVLLSKTRMYSGPLDTYVAWLWDGSGTGTLVLGEKGRFVINTDCRLDNNWRWCG